MELSQIIFSIEQLLEYIQIGNNSSVQQFVWVNVRQFEDGIIYGTGERYRLTV